MTESEGINTPPTSAEPPPMVETARQSWNGWWTLLWALVVMITWLVLQGIVMTAAYFMGGSGQEPVAAMEHLQYDGDVIGILTLICAAIVCPLCFLIGHLKKGWNGWEYLGFKKVGFLQLAIWMAITFLMGLSFNFLAPHVGVQETPEFMQRAAESTQFPILLVLGVALGAPFIEEFIFRGLLFRGWRDSKMGPWVTIILTSLLWTALHVQYDLAVLTWLFLLGIIIGCARQKTGSIWTPIAMHAFNNALASIEIMHLMG